MQNKRLLKGLGISCIVVAIVGLIGVGGYYGYSKLSDKQASSVDVVDTESEESAEVEETEVVITFDEAEIFKELRNERRKGTRVGDIKVDSTYVTSGAPGSTSGEVADGNGDLQEVTYDTEYDPYVPNVEWAKGYLNQVELGELLNTICVVKEDEEGSNIYYKGNIPTEDEMVHFRKNVAYWTNKDGSISLNIVFKKYDLKNLKQQTKYETVTVRWSPYEIEFVR